LRKSSGADMTRQSDRVPLLDARPDLAHLLTADEIVELKAVSLPVIEVERGPLEFDELLTVRRAFGATILDGVVSASLAIGEHAGIHLLGPGDLLFSTGDPWPLWLGESELRASSPVRLGCFGNELLTAAHRSVRLVQGLYVWIGDQLQRLTAQLVICQLPRVEDRVMAMLWLLAESWGHVTPNGVRLPLTLTHETLGALVGARRPTVTLALRKLTGEGALVAQDSGWLLVRPPPQAVEKPTKHVPAEAIMPHSLWATATAPAPAPAPEYTLAHAELLDTVRRLREQHTIDVEHVRSRLTRVRSDRLRNSARREQIAAEALRRRQAPPSS
jgi:CRP/FNR family transcriptional regulator, cyclic AMP receptor protein